MRFVALLVAAVVAVVAGVAVLKFSGDKSSPQSPGQAQPVATVDILVARQPIDVGTMFEAEMVDRQPWPAHLLLEGFIVADGPDASIAGKVARAPFQVNEPIMKGKIGNPNDPSFLAAALPAGMRAVTLATDAISGVAGYVFPGDRVDVIMTHNIPYDAMSRADTSLRLYNKPDVSEVLVTDARVLAVNVRQSAGRETTAAPSSITLEVSEANAQALRLGEKIGALSLALRPLKTQEESEPSPTRAITLTDVKIFGPQTGGVRVVRGADSGKSPGGMRDAMRDMMMGDSMATQTRTPEAVLPASDGIPSNEPGM